MTVIDFVELFATGMIVITPGARAAVPDAEIGKAILRHISGDWGDWDEWEWKENDNALEHGGRLLSRYRSSQGTTFWIITEHDRSVTTIFLPGEN